MWLGFAIRGALLVRWYCKPSYRGRSAITITVVNALRLFAR